MNSRGLYIRISYRANPFYVMYAYDTTAYINHD